MSNTSDPGHGSSPAAWVAVAIMLIAFTIGTFAFWFELPWLVIAAGVLVVVGLIVGWVLAKLGYGVGGHKVKAHE
jgi:protein-S-isoprenylcysteine O-methyltransferase Ste14